MLWTTGEVFVLHLSEMFRFHSFY